MRRSIVLVKSTSTLSHGRIVSSLWSNPKSGRSSINVYASGWKRMNHIMRHPFLRVDCFLMREIYLPVTLQVQNRCMELSFSTAAPWWPWKFCSAFISLMRKWTCASLVSILGWVKTSTKDDCFCYQAQRFLFRLRLEAWTLSQGPFSCLYSLNKRRYDRPKLIEVRLTVPGGIDTSIEPPLAVRCRSHTAAFMATPKRRVYNMAITIPHALR